MGMSREKRPPQHHFRKDTTSTPDIDLSIISLPGEHDFGCSVVSGADVAGHLRPFKTSLTKITEFEITVLVDQNIALFEFTVEDTC
jgi:hypothetical protein